MPSRWATPVASRTPLPRSGELRSASPSTYASATEPIALQTGHHAERDGAVATHDQHHAAGRSLALDGVCHTGGHPRHRVEVAGTGVRPVRRPHRTGDVTDVVDTDAGRGQALDEAQGTESGRREVLSGVVSPGAGRDAEYGELAGHRGQPSSRGSMRVSVTVPSSLPLDHVGATPGRSATASTSSVPS